MEGLLAIAVLISLVLSVWVLIRPFKVANTSFQGRGSQFMLCFAAFVGSLVLFGQFDKDGSRSSAPSTGAASSQSAVGRIGDAVHGRYFSYTVNSVQLLDRVDTGNEFADLERSEGNQYMVLDVTIRNTDTESRMLFDGSIWVNVDGKNYNFDKTEMVMLEGWGSNLDSINPMVTKETKLVWKIPNGISGDAYWQPGREDSDFRISLGSL